MFFFPFWRHAAPMRTAALYARRHGDDGATPDRISTACRRYLFARRLAKYWESSRLRLLAALRKSGIAVANVLIAMEMFMLATQVGLALLFGAAGVVKLVRTDEQVARTPQFSSPQVKLLGLAEVFGAVGLLVPTATGIALNLARVAAACPATLMGGAVATLASSRKSAVFPTVVAMLLIAVATAP